MRDYKVSYQHKTTGFILYTITEAKTKKEAIEKVLSNLRKDGDDITKIRIIEARVAKPEDRISFTVTGEGAKQIERWQSGKEKGKALVIRRPPGSKISEVGFMGISDKGKGKGKDKDANKDKDKAKGKGLDRFLSELDKITQEISEEITKLKADPKWKKKIKVAGDENTSEKLLRALSRDAEKSVRWVVAVNPSTPSDVLIKLTKDKVPFVRYMLAQNPKLPQEAFEILSKDEDWQVREMLENRT